MRTMVLEVVFSSLTPGTQPENSGVLLLHHQQLLLADMIFSANSELNLI